ncbi:MAG TPA: 5'/3'-nucleotidase SurE [Longilinea sp.]|nr:5'/3'-nucleotidase SurE [Longilinea sp.]
MATKQRQILLTNDDSIQSPGLWAAAEALSQLGYVTIAAPRQQSSGAGRSQPPSSDGCIESSFLKIGNQEWKVYAVGGTPAQSVIRGVLEILPEQPDLVVSGINYGENPGTDITASGTIGAAIEGAAMGIPSLAVSLQIENINVEYIRHSRDIDFSTAAYFTQLVAGWMMKDGLPAGVDLIKVDVPNNATPSTTWRITRQAHQRYFKPVLLQGIEKGDSNIISADLITPQHKIEPDTDIHALIIDRVVSITPLTLDMTAPIDLAAWEADIRRKP